MSRDQSPRVMVEGLYDIDGSVQMIDLPLLNVESFEVESNTETNKRSIPGADSDDTVLAPVSGQRRVRLQGQTPFFALDRYYDSFTELEAVRTFCRYIEVLVLPQQGLGWGLEDTVRGTSYNPVDSRGLLFDNVTWDYSGEGEQRIDWTIEGEFSEGVQAKFEPNDYIDRHGSEYTGPDLVEVGNYSLEFDYVDERRLDRSTNINSSDLIHQLGEDSPVVGAIDQGVETEVSVSGSVYQPDNFEGTIQDFDTEIHGEEAILYDAFSGAEWTGTIASSSSTLERARPNRFDFSVTLEIGNVLV